MDKQFLSLKAKVLDAIDPTREVDEAEILDIIDHVFAENSDKISVSASRTNRIKPLNCLFVIPMLSLLTFYHLAFREFNSHS